MAPPSLRFLSSAAKSKEQRAYFLRLFQGGLKEHFPRLFQGVMQRSPLSEPRRCPACPLGLITANDTHHVCGTCLSVEHAIAGASKRPMCESCRLLPRSTRQERLQTRLARATAEATAAAASPAAVSSGEEEEEEEESGDLFGGNSVMDEPAGPILDSAAALQVPDPAGSQREDDEASVSSCPDAAVNLRADFPEVMKLAAESLGLRLPAPLPPKPRDRLREGGFYGAVTPSRPVSGMQRFLRVEGKTDSVFPGLPSLEEALAAIIVPQAVSGWTARKPVPAQPRDKDTLEVLDKISQLCAQQVAAVNNLGMLGVAAAELFPRDGSLPPHESVLLLQRVLGQMNNLTRGLATSAGRVRALTTVGARHVWLSGTSLPRRDRDDLMAVPVSEDGLFGSLSVVTERLKRLDEEKTQLQKHLVLSGAKQPKRPEATQSAQPSKRQRRHARTGKRERPVTAAVGAAAPAPTAAAAAASHPYSGGARPRSRPRAKVDLAASWKKK